MKIDKIYKNPSNPRKISDTELDKLMKSIEKFPKMMELRPIIYNNEGMILGGNTRYEALKRLGYKEIPDNWLKKANELTDKEQLEFIIKDNRLAGEFDYDILTDFFETDDLLDWGFEGFELGQVDDLGEEFNLPSGDKAPFQQMTFTLADEQAEIIQSKIADIKKTDDFKYCETFGNENSNGNALYLLVNGKS